MNSSLSHFMYRRDGGWQEGCLWSSWWLREGPCGCLRADGFTGREQSVGGLSGGRSLRVMLLQWSPCGVFGVPSVTGAPSLSAALPHSLPHLLSLLPLPSPLLTLSLAFPLPVSPCACEEDRALWPQWEGGVCKPGRGPSESVGTLALDFSAPSAVRHKRL